MAATFSLKRLAEQAKKAGTSLVTTVINQDDTTPTGAMRGDTCDWQQEKAALEAKLSLLRANLGTARGDAAAAKAALEAAQQQLATHAGVRAEVAILRHENQALRQAAENSVPRASPAALPQSSAANKRQNDLAACTDRLLTAVQVAETASRGAISVEILEELQVLAAHGQQDRGWHQDSNLHIVEEQLASSNALNVQQEVHLEHLRQQLFASQASLKEAEIRAADAEAAAEDLRAHLAEAEETALAHLRTADEQQLLVNCMSTDLAAQMQLAATLQQQLQTQAAVEQELKALEQVATSQLTAAEGRVARLQEALDESNKRVERLQTANKQRHRELEAMQARVAASTADAHQSRVAARQAQDDLAAAQQLLAQLQLESEAYASASTRLVACQTELAAQAARSSAADRECERLADELAALKRDSDALLSGSRRAAAVEEAAAAGAAEAAQLEQRARLAEEEAAHERAARAHAEAALEDLAAQPPAAWPPAVRALVEAREAQAAQSALLTLRAAAEAAAAEAEAAAEELRSQARQAHERQRLTDDARREAEARAEALAQELRAREAALQAAATASQAAALLRLQTVEDTVARLQSELEATREAGIQQVQAWRLQYERAVAEAAEVRQRALSQLLAKDAQLAKAQGRRSSAGGEQATAHSSEDTAPLPTSRSLSQTSSSGATPAASLPMYVASPEIVPADSGQQMVDTNLKARVQILEAALADSERTHELRDRAAEVLKEELAELRRGAARERVDLDYLKNVLIAGFESGELPRQSSLAVVLARLLHFSPVEMQRVQRRPKPRGS